MPPPSSRSNDQMLDPETHSRLKTAIVLQVSEDTGVLAELRDRTEELRNHVSRPRPRMAPAMSLIGPDGGINRVRRKPPSGGR